ncbi:MAG: acyl-CoA thioesterase [Halobacteriota archaeon]
MTYTRTWTVRFADCDPFGIAHYPRIVDAVHDTSARFMESVGWPYYEMTAEHGIGLPIVEVSLAFDTAIRAGDQIQIDLEYRMGTSSLRFEYAGRRESTTVFEGFEQRVCVGVGEESGQPIPEGLRQALDSA